MVDSVSSDQSAAAERLANIFTRTWNAQDGPGYGEAYWDDAELVDPTGQIWDGRDAIVAMHVQLWSGPGSTTKVDARVRRVRSVDDNVMVVDLEVNVRGFAPAPPGATVQADGSVTARLKHVVEKRSDEWKIVASQNTFVAVPTQTPR
jgi:uncharacterized protein (TIGR02246 family)